MKFFRSSIVALLALFSLMGAGAVERPVIDLNSIKVDVTMSPSKYRELLNRLIDGDSTLTINEMATVYYGYASTYDYNPSLSYEEIHEAFDLPDYSKVYRLAIAALDRDPLSVDLTAMALVAAEREPGDEAARMKERLQQRYNKLVELILLSGRGTVPESPFIVISESDLQAILRYVLYINEVVERGYFGSYDVVRAKYPQGDRDIVLFFNNPYQTVYEAENQ